MSRFRAGVLAGALCVVAAGGGTTAQGTARRLTTLDALRQFPGYYHLQSVLLRGEFIEAGGAPTFRADDQEMTVALDDQVRTTTGPVEVRGRLIDVGRLERGDPRVPAGAGERDGERWPKPGEELVLSVSGVAAADPAVTPSIRALALEPWKFDGQAVTLVGQFRGRNILGDLPSSPAKSRYDFVLRSADAAVWVTGLRPRGRGFELSVDARVDTGRWVQITGTVSRERGLVMIAGTAIAEAKAPAATADEAEEAAAPAVPVLPLEVVFNSPTADEINVAPTGTVRVQFSKGVNVATLEGQIRVTYLGDAADAPRPAFQHAYDAATRALELRFTQPLDRLKTVRIELLDGIKAFDGAPFQPWTLTFSVSD